MECQAAESFSLEMSSLADRYRSGATCPTQVIQHLWDGLAASCDLSIWIHLLSLEELQSQAQSLERRSAGREALPLYGVPFAVKDNIDVAGYPTTAACPAYSYVAERSAPVVSRLIEAGAIFVGKTNMDQFSTGLAGDRSPHGVPANPFDSSRISGGSSSGSAVAVARGLVSFALGSDTAGSGSGSGRLQQYRRLETDARHFEHGGDGSRLSIARLRSHFRHDVGRCVDCP